MRKVLITAGGSVLACKSAVAPTAGMRLTKAADIHPTAKDPVDDVVASLESFIHNDDREGHFFDPEPNAMFDFGLTHCDKKCVLEADLQLEKKKQAQLEKEVGDCTEVLQKAQEVLEKAQESLPQSPQGKHTVYIQKLERIAKRAQEARKESEEKLKASEEKLKACREMLKASHEKNSEAARQLAPEVSQEESNMPSERVIKLAGMVSAIWRREDSRRREGSNQCVV